MKTQIIIFFILSISICMGGCSDKDNPDPVTEPADLETIINSCTCLPTVTTGEAGDILGKWKLVLFEDETSTEGKIDYSCHSVVYQFKADEVLVLTSDIEAIPSGRFLYEKDTMNPTTGLMIEGLFFDGTIYDYTITAKHMQLVSSKTQLTYYFVRTGMDEEGFVEDAELKEKLIGVWSIVYNGFGDPDDLSDTTYGTVEFLPNGIFRRYTRYPEEYTEKDTYRITADYFYKDRITDGEVIMGGKWIYKYSFYEDKFRTDVVRGLVSGFDKTRIYKRKT